MRSKRSRDLEAQKSGGWGHWGLDLEIQSPANPCFYEPVNPNARAVRATAKSADQKFHT